MSGLWAEILTCSPIQKNLTPSDGLCKMKRAGRYWGMIWRAIHLVLGEGETPFSSCFWFLRISCHSLHPSMTNSSRVIRSTARWLCSSYQGSVLVNTWPLLQPLSTSPSSCGHLIWHLMQRNPSTRMLSPNPQTHIQCLSILHSHLACRWHWKTGRQRDGKCWRRRLRRTACDLQENMKKRLARGADYILL